MEFIHLVVSNQAIQAERQMYGSFFEGHHAPA